MLDRLEHVEARMLSLLPPRPCELGPWHTKRIDYHPPVVDRMYRDLTIEGAVHRLYLHRIHPCAPGASLFHPHPWPSAIRVLPVSGSTYEMAVSLGDPAGEPPPVAALLRVAGGLAYEMIEPRGWHSVRILGMPSISVMLTGPLWARPEGEIHATMAFEPLGFEEQRAILGPVRGYYAALEAARILREAAEAEGDGEAGSWDLDGEEIR